MFRKILSVFFNPKDSDPEQAYDAWAESYDQQPDNLMLALDESVFSGLLSRIEVKNKRVTDVGCGTGRHWKKIAELQPQQLEGYDVSAGMLKILKQKFPQANTHQLKDYKLEATADGFADLLISTLTIAHIENAEQAMQEWNRAVKGGGDIIITDYHPAVLEKGGKRTFKKNGQTVSVKNYIHSLEKIKVSAAKMGWQLESADERKIDE